MNHERHAKPDFGNQPALVADRRRKPDRRQVSARWLAGTLLTGVTSTAMMGIALSAAHDGHRTLSAPAIANTLQAASGDLTERGERVFATAIPIERNRSTIEVPTILREGGREVVKSLPFAYASMLLGARHPASGSYPAFDAMSVFGDDDDADEAPPAENGQIYGAKVEGDVKLAVEAFDLAGTTLDDFADIGTKEAEQLVRAASPRLDQAPVRVAAIQPFDATRFGGLGDPQVYLPGAAFRVIQENVSVSAAEVAASRATRYGEEIVPFREDRPIGEALEESGHADAAAPATALANLLGRDEMGAGEVLRLGLEPLEDGGSRIVRVSAYRGERHLATAALSDDGRFTRGPEPALSRSVAEAFDENATEAPLRPSMPTVYDGVWQAGLAYGLDDRLCRRLVKILAPDVDYQARLDPTDRLTLLYSLEDGQDKASDQSQILYVEASFGGTTKRYYRFFTDDDDQTDYYDEAGRSARQFLLRNPVPNGRFTSPFGSRRHPILGYARMHWGVDWAAPRGTPILASGAGVVERAGWSTGNGQQTLIRHANGYETSYSHQSVIAKGVTAGARVRQGQIIGYVGSTGLSTGNHLHYEVSVNGTRVDPLRIRLPTGRQLQGEQLEAFDRERQRIDNLLKESVEEMKVAGR
ncbi:M23 family metallopeptidase [Aureimonas pseudogalii]|uniref:Murein DD-endopeptidase MepM/ murein hydrolase activator NlpD n=1 Tax=Aureimonas pseudogalii TaxID=1744844 RepID=A0A7W6H6P4_9HYPH|nr:M23 family metallopeptidase [Aureimonas pseudogalii]MBB3999574.1 murein DD-endopeptidase MepM/ murein hydrolase activator NlpD [Aureimonas pseudogalii]